MKGSAPAGVLAKAISLASAVRRGADGGVAHLATKGDAISITCTDQTVGTIATSVPAMIGEPGEAAVSPGRLTALLSSFPDGAMVGIEATPGAVNVTCGPSRLRLPAVPVAESPAAITIEQEIGVSGSAASTFSSS
jgi:DNA polymerase III sliding clamp (beta) subunit (PCNA family)